MIGSKNAAEGWASFAAALAAHGALALGIAASPGVSGAGGRQTTAIGLNLIDTAIIEAALEPRASQAEARHRDVDEHAGKRENSQPAPAQRERREEITAAIGARPQLTRHGGGQVRDFAGGLATLRAPYELERRQIAR